MKTILKTILKTTLACGCVLFSGAALADVPAAGEPTLDNAVAVSVSPIHLVLPVVELQVEIYATEKISVALIGGYGKVTVDQGFLGEQTFTVWEAGAQARVYPTGSVQDGIYLGAEVLKLGVSGDVDNVSGTGEGLEIGGIVGYKWVWQSGFLIDLNGGAGYLASKAEASDGLSSAEEDASDVVPILNFNLGYAF